MSQQDFTTTVQVDQTPMQVFNTLRNVRSWWSGLFDESFEGKAEQPGDEFSFSAGGGAHFTRQKLVEAIPGQKLEWLVTEANLSFVDKPDEWTGTRFKFDISEENGKTKVVFTHVGLVPEFECYESCSSAWTQYIRQQLIAALSAETGTAA